MTQPQKRIPKDRDSDPGSAAPFNRGWSARQKNKVHHQRPSRLRRAYMDDIEEVRAYYRALLPLYDASLQDRGDLLFWESVARRAKAKRILDLGCGTGRVTAVLSRHGTVIAVDLLLEMLQRASRQAPRAGLIAADLRSFAFRAAFDLIVLSDDPMAHLTSGEDRLAVIKLIADHLTSSGQVVLEGLYRPERRNVDFSRTFTHEGRQWLVKESWNPTAKDAVWDVTYRYDDGVSTTRATATVKSWTIEDVEILRQAGLEIESMWGDFDERPFSENAARILIVARKAEHAVR
jgi:SAM-dependent methyltransferase